MPRLAPDANPKYRKHKASGQAIVTLSGRDHSLGPYGSAACRREYDRLIAEWLAGGRLPLAEANDRVIVEVNLNLIERLWKFLKRRALYGRYHSLFATVGPPLSKNSLNFRPPTAQHSHRS